MNVARFRLPVADPANADFMKDLARVNAIADRSAGFVWRLVGSGDDATDLRVDHDPNLVVNMSVWSTIDTLCAFAYGDPDHLAIMRRRREWFDKMEFHMALWWVPAGHLPTVADGLSRIDLIRTRGPGPDAFNFSSRFQPTSHLPPCSQHPGDRHTQPT
ncbi:DUF3291 domain-containing protein [Sphingomonas sp. UYP23]